MPPRGRKPAPKSIKILKGSQPCRINHDEPEAIEPVSSDPPVILDDVALAEWDRLFPILSRMKVLSESDISALAIYCTAWSQWQAAEEHVRDHGLAVLVEDKGFQVNPMIRVAEKARTQCLRFLGEFGCTPSARTRIKPEGGKSGDEMDDFLKGKKRTRRA